MDRRPLRLAALLVGIVAAGCGGGSQKYPDATVFGDGSTRADGGGVDTALPPPVPGTGSKQLVPGNAFLVGGGANSCTNQVPASGDRWCAFAMPGAFSGFIDLWVINVTQAAAGTSIQCNTGSDPNCLRLTTDLFIDASADIQIHGFDGDTLIYYAEVGPTFAGGSFVGPVYAWRPGWGGGRKLTSDTGVLCIGHATTQTALCFENLVQTTSAGAPCVATGECQANYDLHAGPVPAVNNGPLLPKLDTVLLATRADGANVVKFGFGLSPDGTYAAWSARPTATGVETLKVQKIGDAAATVVASDVSRWIISPDGTRWYWLKGYNYNVSGAASGTLESAPFPGGASPVTLAANVGDFDHAGTAGVLFRDTLTTGRGGLKLIADRDTPTAVTALDTGVVGVVQVSDDGTKVVYAKSIDSLTGGSDLFMATAGAATPCTLTAMRTGGPTASFLSNGSGLLWENLDLTAQEIAGMFATGGGCTSAKFASDIFLWQRVGAEGFVYGDDSPSTVFEVTLRYSKVAGATLPMGQSVQTRAAPVFTPLLPAMAAVVYTVNTGTTGAMGDGLYINATLPFTVGQ